MDVFRGHRHTHPCSPGDVLIFCGEVVEVQHLGDAKEPWRTGIRSKDAEARVHVAWCRYKEFGEDSSSWGRGSAPREETP